MADYKGRIGNLIRDARKHRGLTQHQLAELLGTSQSAINRIEKGHQNLSLEMLARIGAALDSEIVALGAGPTHLRVDGPTTLSGSIDVKTSKNAGVALLCASLLNKGRTTLRKVARIEEVNRLLEVLNSPRRRDPLAQRRQRPRDHPAGRAQPRRDRRGRRPAHPLGDHVPGPAAAPLRRVRPPLRRRLQPRRAHRRAAHVGAASLRPRRQGHRRQLPREREPRPSSPSARSCSPSAATRSPRTRSWPPRSTRARRSSATPRPTTWSRTSASTCASSASRSRASAPPRCRVTGRTSIDVDVDYAPSEDPIEAMSLLAAAIVTKSEITIRRVPIEFLEIELATLEEMGFRYDRSEEYVAHNGETRLVDLTTHASDLRAPLDKIHPMPFPGLNIDNLPFFAVIAAVADGPDAAARLGLREPRDLPHRAQQARRARSSCSTRTGCWSRARRTSPARRSSARRRCARRWCCCIAMLASKGTQRAALDVRHPPRLRGPRRAAQRARRQHRDLPRHLRRAASTEERGRRVGAARSSRPRG